MNQQELIRQSVHLLLGTLFIIGYVRGALQWWAFFVLLVAALLITLIIHTTTLVNIDSLLRRHERTSTYIPGWGALTLLKGFLVTTLLFPKEIGVLALIVLVYGDAAATLIGSKHGATALSWNTKKSWEGLLAGLLTSFIIIALATNWALALLVATTGMLIESMNKSPWFDDNIAIPLLTGILLTIIL